LSPRNGRAIGRSTPDAFVGSPARDQQSFDAVAVARRMPAERDRRACGEHDADRDGFAVQPALVVADGLERVAERVAEVQQRSPALLALVLGDDGALISQLRRIACVSAAGRGASSRRRCSSSQSKNGASTMNAVLDDLREPGSELARR
jgi:hypothetical protein